MKLNRLDSDWQQRTSEMQRRANQAEQQSSQLLEQNSQLKRELEITKNKNRDLEAMLDAGKRNCDPMVYLWWLCSWCGFIVRFVNPIHSTKTPSQ